MKKCLTLLIATVLSGISLTAYAAQPMSNLDSGQLRPAGTVSATGASNLSDLEDKLAEKAREQGAKGYVINSAGGNCNFAIFSGLTDAQFWAICLP